MQLHTSSAHTPTERLAHTDIKSVSLVPQSVHPRPILFLFSASGIYILASPTISGAIAPSASFARHSTKAARVGHSFSCDEEIRPSQEKGERAVAGP